MELLSSPPLQKKPHSLTESVSSRHHPRLRLDPAAFFTPKKRNPIVFSTFTLHPKTSLEKKKKKALQFSSCLAQED